MRNAKRRPPAGPRQDNGWDGDRRNVAGVGEFKAVAARILDAGAYYLRQGRDWLETATATSGDDMDARSRQRRERQEAGYHDLRGREGDLQGSARGRDLYDEAEDARAAPRGASGEGGVYAPDEYSFSETGERTGSGRFGHDYDDRRARAFDRRADELARDRGRQDSPYHAEAGDADRIVPGRDDELPGSDRHGAGPGNDARHRKPSYPRRDLGSQRGRGPRGYMRSDERILEDVSERLSDDPVVDASDIEVRCESGRIVLEGQVPTRWMKHRAEDIADSIPGARDVDNRIRVTIGDDPASGSRERSVRGTGAHAGDAERRESVTAANPDGGHAREASGVTGNSPQAH